LIESGNSFLDKEEVVDFDEEILLLFLGFIKKLDRIKYKSLFTYY
jgi:hypothetical protein